MDTTKKREKEKFSLFNRLDRSNFLADAPVKLYSFLRWNFIIIYKAVDASFYRLQKDIKLLEPKNTKTTLKVISILRALNLAHGRKNLQNYIFQSNYFFQLFTLIHFYIMLAR